MADPFNLHVNEMPLGPNGVRDFFWPVSLEELRGVCREITYSTTALVREAVAHEVAGAGELALISNYIATEVLSWYRVQAAYTRLVAAGRRPELPERMTMWRFVAGEFNDAQALDTYSARLRDGFPQKDFRHYLRKPWKRLAACFAAAGARPDEAGELVPDMERIAPPKPPRSIHSGTMSRARLRDAVITTKRGDIVSFHAEAEDLPVYQAGHDYWFAPLSGRDRQPFSEVFDSLLTRRLGELINAAFQVGGETPLPWVREFMLTSFGRSASFVAAHLRRLRARPKRLPRRLWTGSGGNVWDRMLRVAVRERGGETTVHAHAGAREYLITPYLGFNEYFACDRFITYTPEQARLAYAHIDERLLFGPAPRIEATAIPRQSRFWQTLTLAEGEPVRKVMYMSTFLFGKQRLSQAPFMADVVAVDWTMRLFGQLRGWGLDVTNKAHPESRWSPPDHASRVLGVPAVLERFESVAPNADLFLFDSVTTSTFVPAMLTAKPIVVVDFGQLPWEPESLELLRRRCAYVRGWYDAENRAQVDWEALRTAIAEAPSLARDTTFIRTYFEG